MRLPWPVGVGTEGLAPQPEKLVPNGRGLLELQVAGMFLHRLLQAADLPAEVLFAEHVVVPSALCRGGSGSGLLGFVDAVDDVLDAF